MILTCSDSRVPVEIVFDRGVGDMFVIRVAGNVCGEHEAGTIDYAVDHLKTPLLVVLGHSHCGAVTAVATDAALPSNVSALVRSIRTAAEAAKKLHPDQHGRELVPATTRCNVWQSIDDLFRQSPITRELVSEGKLKVVGAIYQVETGKIDWLGVHPEQARLLNYKNAPTQEGRGAKRTGDTVDEPKQ
jgi:carbonic anhydrase